MVLTTEDVVELEELYRQCFNFAKELTKENPNLFKTTFQCLFWEGCHYVFGLKLKAKKTSISK